LRDHLKVLGWLYLATGGLVLLLAAVAGTILGVAGLATAAAELGVVAFAVSIVIAAVAVPSLICGWGLLTYRPWARVLGIVLSALQLGNFPVGTAMGGYGLWVLLNEDAKRLLDAGDPRYGRLGTGW
jgi:hypothetical protein